MCGSLFHHVDMISDWHYVLFARDFYHCEKQLQFIESIAVAVCETSNKKKFIKDTKNKLHPRIISSDTTKIKWLRKTRKISKSKSLSLSISNQNFS